MTNQNEELIFNITFESDGSWHAECTNAPIVSQGDYTHNVRAMLLDAVMTHFGSMRTIHIVEYFKHD